MFCYYLHFYIEYELNKQQKINNHASKKINNQINK
jgi:hypothetical protein